MLFGNNFRSDPQFTLLCGPNIEGKARRKFMGKARLRWKVHLKQTVAGHAVVVVDDDIDEWKWKRKLSRFYC